MIKSDIKKMTREELKPKMQVGDFNTLGKALDINPEAARKRFNRDDEEALYAMQVIIYAREQVIDKLSK